MGKFSILLCDSDEVYTKRLAARLQHQFRQRVSVRTCSEPEVAEDSCETDLLLTSREPGADWRRLHPNCICLWLDEDGPGSNTKQRGELSEAGSLLQPEGTPRDWRDSVFKYQSVSKMAGVLQQYIPALAGSAGMAGIDTRQHWYGVVSPVRHESMLPFACALAGELGKEKRVLLIDLVEFSGLYSLLELEEGEGLENFLFRLRQREPMDRSSMPEVQVLPGFDLLRGPANPMVLYELNEHDMACFIEWIRSGTGYDAVVWAAGNMLQGIRELFCGSEKIFVLEKTDTYSCCCQQEFEQFFNRLGQSETGSMISVCLPAALGSQTGKHLLWQWEHAPVGEEARRGLKGGKSDGAVDGTAEKSDSGTAGYEWRDL